MAQLKCCLTILFLFSLGCSDSDGEQSVPSNASQGSSDEPTFQKSLFNSAHRLALSYSTGQSDSADDLYVELRAIENEADTAAEKAVLKLLDTVRQARFAHLELDKIRESMGKSAMDPSVEQTRRQIRLIDPQGKSDVSKLMALTEEMDSAYRQGLVLVRVNPTLEQETKIEFQAELADVIKQNRIPTKSGNVGDYVNYAQTVRLFEALTTTAMKNASLLIANDGAMPK